MEEKTEIRKTFENLTEIYESITKTSHANLIEKGFNIEFAAYEKIVALGILTAFNSKEFSEVFNDYITKIVNKIFENAKEEAKDE